MSADEGTKTLVAAGRRGVSIATLCAVVVVAALDFRWWRAIHGDINTGYHSLLGFRGPALDAAAMPMASVLVVGLAHGLINGRKFSRRSIGFLAGGFAGLALYFAYNYACMIIDAGFGQDYLPRGLVKRSMAPIYIAHANWPWLNTLGSDYFYYADMLYFGPPQFFMAGLGTLIARKRAPKAQTPSAEITPPSEPTP